VSRQLLEIESLLQQLVAEHRKLLGQLDAQQAGMRAVKLDAIEQSTHQQESTRLRIATLETKRRALGLQIARAMRIAEEPTITRLAQLFPGRSTALIKLRDELKAVIGEISARTSLAGRLAAAVLGHLNVGVRLIATAVEQAGVYTKDGSPQMTKRIGVMEAVG
jgi:hypothetical protein